MGQHQINVGDFGTIDPTGVANSTLAFQVALAKAVGRHVEVVWPAGVFKVDSQIIYGHTRVAGAPGYRTTLIASGNGANSTFLSSNTHGAGIRDLVLDCNNIIQDGYFVSGLSIGLSRVKVRRAVRYGIFIRLGLVGIDAIAEDCGSHGCYMSSANASTIVSLISRNNGGYGLFADGKFADGAGGSDPAGGVFVNYARLENNALGAIKYDGVEGGNIIHADCAPGAGDGVHQDDSHNVTYRGIVLRGGADPDRAVRLEGTSRTQHFDCVHTLPASGGSSSPFFNLRQEGGAISGTLKTNDKLISRTVSTDIPTESV
jgi:hypothetical protein